MKEEKRQDQVILSDKLEMNKKMLLPIKEEVFLGLDTEETGTVTQSSPPKCFCRKCTQVEEYFQNVNDDSVQTKFRPHKLAILESMPAQSFYPEKPSVTRGLYHSNTKGDRDKEPYAPQPSIPPQNKDNERINDFQIHFYSHIKDMFVLYHIPIYVSDPMLGFN